MCTKKTNLKNAVADALKNCPQDLLRKPFTSIEEVLSVDITGCRDDKKQPVTDDYLENCKEGNFDASVMIEGPFEDEDSGKIISRKTVSGTFKADYDTETCSFKNVEIEHIYIKQ